MVVEVWGKLYAEEMLGSLFFMSSLHLQTFCRGEGHISSLLHGVA